MMKKLNQKKAADISTYGNKRSDFQVPHTCKDATNYPCFTFSTDAVSFGKETHKGQSILITHAILVGFTIFLLLVVMNTFMTLREDFQNFAAHSEIDQVCMIIKSGIEKLFLGEEYRSQTNTTSRIDLNLPEKLVDTSYRASFVNKSIDIATLSPRYNSTCRIGLDMQYSGFTTGGSTEIIFTRNSTADAIEMRSI
jgi:hypothetical protein